MREIVCLFMLIACLVFFVFCLINPIREALVDYKIKEFINWKAEYKGDTLEDMVQIKRCILISETHKVDFFKRWQVVDMKNQEVIGFFNSIDEAVDRAESIDNFRPYEWKKGE